MHTYTNHQPEGPSDDTLLGRFILVIALVILLVATSCTATKPGNVHMQFGHWWTLQNHGHGQVIIHHPACPNPDHRKQQK